MSTLQQQLQEMRLQARTIEPDFEPECDLQLCHLMFEHELGQQLYNTLDKPTRQDERWMSLCCAILGQRERAYEHLLRAIEMGYEEAQIDLVPLHYMLGKPEEMWQLVNTLDVSQFSKFNQAIWYRNLALVHSLNNNVKVALLNIEKSWQVIQTAPEFKFYASEVLLMCSNLHAAVGNEDKRVYYLSRAEELCQTKYKWQIKLIIMLTNLDNTDLDGMVDLALEIIEGSNNPRHVVISTVSIGRIFMCYGQLQEARKYFEEALSRARQAVMRENLSIIYGYLSMIYYKLKMPQKMWVMLNKMKPHATAGIDESVLKCQLAYMDDSLTPQEALRLSDEALAYAESSDVLLETMRVYMYRCEVFRKHFPERFEAAVDELVQFMVRTDQCNGTFEDWIIIEEVFDFINVKYPDLLPKVSSNQLEIQTLGTERIQYNGRDLKLPLSKSLELIVYILLHKKVSLNSILTHVFEDLDPIKAKNYFHQIKHQVAEKVGLLWIEYDKNTRLYSIESKYRVVLDVQEHLEKNQKSDQVFLPSSGSEWVLDFNGRIMHS
ncbi:hypothetical protein [Deinococcus roseus]|uniref:MalT-like TPR region domain-containing protein n=1 Tax=Deinococcus roseus TaxID=392414 RepID=A0ABQ2D2Q0_9DEIO|nr:hypothetical protein [Deinococcus roseus]GGJ43547.1 hypothetical protein GCM10008938_32290 [Deinococcus roseus]